MEQIDARTYWEHRYSSGGNSGIGSYGKLAQFKATIINWLVEEFGINSVIEFGCGDGNQLLYAKYPNYIGFDISPTAIMKCKDLFQLDSDKRFKLMEDYAGERADLTLSLDVIYHILDNKDFLSYMEVLFGAADRYVIVYSSDYEDEQRQHERRRRFTTWVNENAPGWRLIYKIPNIYRKYSFSDFYIYGK